MNAPGPGRWGVAGGMLSAMVGGGGRVAAVFRGGLVREV